MTLLQDGQVMTCRVTKQGIVTLMKFFGGSSAPPAWTKEAHVEHVPGRPRSNTKATTSGQAQCWRNTESEWLIFTMAQASHIKTAAARTELGSTHEMDAKSWRTRMRTKSRFGNEFCHRSPACCVCVALVRCMGIPENPVQWVPP